MKKTILVATFIVSLRRVLGSVATTRLGLDVVDHLTGDVRLDDKLIAEPKWFANISAIVSIKLVIDFATRCVLPSRNFLTTKSGYHSSLMKSVGFAALSKSY